MDVHFDVTNMFPFYLRIWTFIVPGLRIKIHQVKDILSMEKAEYLLQKSQLPENNNRFETPCRL